MKILVKAVLAALVLTSCDTPPLTQQDLEFKIAYREAALSCAQKGWISYLPETTAFIGILERQINAGATSEQIQSVEKRISGTVNRQVCRTVEMEAIQNQQGIAEQEKQLAQFQASMNHLGDSANSIRQSTPGIGGCQYYEWGNMVSCY